MRYLELKKDIYWLGAVDYDSRDFHGYSLSPSGTTYNAYLIKDEKVALFDTVKDIFGSVLKSGLKELIEPEKVDYIIVNHVELDHSGALAEMVELCKPEKIFCSTMGKKALETHFDITGWPINVVKTGDTISLGKRTVTFIEARMLHWPDSMFSYIAEEKMLICNDAFGQNIASTERFVDEIDPTLLRHLQQEYYYNIVVPFSSVVLKTLAAVAELKLDIEFIAPDHGLMYRTKKDVQNVLAAYREFAEQKPQKRAVVVYDTMWHSTESMAYAIAEGLESAGVPTRIMSLKSNHHSAVMTELANCGAFVIGSSTHNNGILPNVAGMLTYIKGLKIQNRIGAAFGSYGWSGEAVAQMTEQLESMGMEVPVTGIRTQFVPKEAFLKECMVFGKAVGEALVAKCKE